MADETGRPLTPGERAALSAGMAEALDAAGAEPRIVPAPCARADLAGSGAATCRS